MLRLLRTALVQVPLNAAMTNTVGSLDSGTRTEKMQNISEVMKPQQHRSIWDASLVEHLIRTLVILLTLYSLFVLSLLFGPMQRGQAL